MTATDILHRAPGGLMNALAIGPLDRPVAILVCVAMLVWIFVACVLVAKGKR